MKVLLFRKIGEAKLCLTVGPALKVGDGCDVSTVIDHSYLMSSSAEHINYDVLLHWSECEESALIETEILLMKMLQHESSNKRSAPMHRLLSPFGASY